MNLFLWLGLQVVFLILSLTLAIMTSIALANAKNYYKSFGSDTKDTPAAQQASKAVNELGWATAIAWIIFALYLLAIIIFVVLNLTGVGEVLEAGEAGTVGEQILAKEAFSAGKTAEALSKSDIKGAGELQKKEEELGALIENHGGSIVKNPDKTVHRRTKDVIEDDMKNRLKAINAGILHYSDTMNFEGTFNMIKSGTFLGAIGGIFLVGILAAMGATDLNNSINKAANNNLTVTGHQTKSQNIHNGDTYSKKMNTGNGEASSAAVIALIPGSLFLLWTFGNYYYININKKAAQQDVADETEIIDALLTEAKTEVHQQALLAAYQKKEKIEEAKSLQTKKMNQEHELNMALIEHGVDPRELKLKALELQKEQQKADIQATSHKSHNPFHFVHRSAPSTSQQTTAYRTQQKAVPQTQRGTAQSSGQTASHANTQAATSHPDTHATAGHPDTHATAGHTDTHATAGHTDTHATAGHTDTHSTTGHSTAGHTDTHSTTGHSTAGHTDTHSTTGHSTAGHADTHSSSHDTHSTTSHTDTHSSSHDSHASASTTHSSSHPPEHHSSTSSHTQSSNDHVSHVSAESHHSIGG
jgi:hypothetical protein